MKTEVEMKRELFGVEITQKSKSEFFSATDLVRAGNKWRGKKGLDKFNVSLYFRKESTIEFVSELEKKYGNILIKGRGRAAQTWVHPLLFIDMALAISPKLKIEVYEWLFDNLIRFRNDSGDSYKEMCGALYTRCSNVKEFPKIIKEVAEKIQEACGVDDWQRATEKQLHKRDKIHDSIKTLCRVCTKINKIVDLAIDENKKR
jgi:hypothetical protein